MTKTLTEQWREGTLPSGFYYLKMKDGLILTDHTIYIVGEKQYRWELSSIDYVAEVLAPVPSYDEYKELVRKSDKLDKIMSDAVTNPEDCQQIVEDNLNRQIKRLQEQLEKKDKLIEKLKKDKKDCKRCAFNCFHQMQSGV